MPVNIPFDKPVSQDLYAGTSEQQIDALTDLLMHYDTFAKQSLSLEAYLKQQPAQPPDANPAARPAGQPAARIDAAPPATGAAPASTSDARPVTSPAAGQPAQAPGQDAKASRGDAASPEKISSRSRQASLN